MVFLDAGGVWELRSEADITGAEHSSEGSLGGRDANALVWAHGPSRQATRRSGSHARRGLASEPPGRKSRWGNVRWHRARYGVLGAGVCELRHVDCAH